MVIAMKKRYPDTHQEHDYGVGFPLDVIEFLMLAISTYLVAMNAQIDPPKTAAVAPTSIVISTPPGAREYRPGGLSSAVELPDHL
jgi:hypothetical protein